MTDPTQRFSNRVDNYRRYRPGYAPGTVAALEEAVGLTPAWVVADVGSGTGISATPFLENGNVVYGVEPNAPMRAAAEAALGDRPRFRSVDGTAEATTLADASVDLVVAAQAFHWFDVPRTRREFARVLRPGGWVALLWNRRPTGGTPFLDGYEALLQRYGTDYREVHHRHVDDGRLDAFFGPGAWRRLSLPNDQTLTWDELRGRLLSASYVPAEGQPGHREMLADLERLYGDNAADGRVVMPYSTDIYLGRLDVPIA